MNFRTEPQDVTFALPVGGAWRLRLNTDWDGYSRDFGGHESGDLFVHEGEHAGHPCSASATVGPYSALVFSR